MVVVGVTAAAAAATAAVARFWLSCSPFFCATHAAVVCTSTTWPSFNNNC